MNRFKAWIAAVITLIILWLVLESVLPNFVTPQDETDYVSIAIDFYSKQEECFAYGIVANGLIYFLTEDGKSKQIGEYEDIESYLQGGLQYIQKALNNICS